MSNEIEEITYTGNNIQDVLSFVQKVHPGTFVAMNRPKSGKAILVSPVWNIYLTKGCIVRKNNDTIIVDEEL